MAKSKVDVTKSEDDVTENARIRRRRMVAFGEEDAGKEADKLKVSNDAPEDLVGLALSGGGIRSALFNDGLLQALSHRGFLRYVDYISSVSGGGYIAGHLMTQVSVSQKKPREESGSPHQDSESQPANFHEDTDPVHYGEQGPTSKTASNIFMPWHFGRHPITRKVDERRLPEIGAYLNRTFSFVAGYLLHQLPVVLLYLSLLGVISTAISIYYRSFDAPEFREIFPNVLGVRFGDELLIAFLPTIGITMACIAVSLIQALWRLTPTGARQHGKAKANFGGLVQMLVGGLVLSSICSIAVYLGNSFTKATSNPAVAHSTNLNHFAVQIMVVAAIIQLLVFLGRDRLFRSEKSESPQWKKVTQSLIANGVVVFLFFSMVHLMARENISRYIGNRDPYLVRGEVSDWRYLQTLDIPDLAEKKDTQKTSFLEISDYASANTTGISRALHHWKSDFAEFERSIPESPSEKKDRANVSLLGTWNRLGLILQSCVLPERVPDWLPGCKPIGDIRAEVKSKLERQETLVARINSRMEKRDFTTMLISEIFSCEAKVSKVSMDVLGDVLARGRVLIEMHGDFLPREKVPTGTLGDFLASATVKRRVEALTNSQRQELEKLLRHHENGILASSEDRADAGATRPVSVLNRVTLNRALLNLCGEGDSILFSSDVARTPVVQPHDQSARWRWLTIWMGFLGVSLLLTADLNQNSHLFHFYRKGISENFLKGAPNGISGKTHLKDIKSHQFGLPFPIYLTTWLMPSLNPGAERVAQAVAMTPRETLLRGVARIVEGRQAEDRDAIFTPLKAADQLNIVPGESEVSLEDAVAVSGAAVTPTMTNTSALALLMDVFGVRLGIWFSTASASSNSKLQSLLSALGVLAVATPFAWLLNYPELPGYWLLNFGLGITIIMIAAYQFKRGTGYVQVVWSLWKTSRSQEKESTAPNGLLDCWPRAFVSDGGFYDYLGVTELLRRKCDLIVVSDAGINSGSQSLESLADLCERSSSELGIRILDFDHESPIDFARLEKDVHQRVPQPYIAMRIRYADGTEGHLFYVQMAISKNDPIEIQQIRYRFPSFPGEPTSNQFYTRDQSAAYRDLGYHIGNRLCSHLHRWTVADIKEGKCTTDSGVSQPFFEELKRRLCRGYLQACYEEYYYKDDDVYGESIWSGVQENGDYPSWNRATKSLREINREEASSKQDLASHWLDQFNGNADVASRYMEAINHDVNCLHQRKQNEPAKTYRVLCDVVGLPIGRSDEIGRAEPPDFWKGKGSLLTAHFVVLAAACQQLHRGTPHAIFQIGGRDKLLDTVGNLVKEIGAWLTDIGDTPKLNVLCVGFSDVVIHEVAEMRESVFQSANDLAVVSFIQCLCMQLAEYYKSLKKNIEKEESSSPSGRQFHLSLDFRQLMIDRLQSGYRSSTSELIAAYLKYLLLAKEDKEADDHYADQIDVELHRTVSDGASWSRKAR